jgi:hypothetical protein
MRSKKYGSALMIASVLALAAGAVPAYATVTQTNTFNASGTASGDPHLLKHTDSGSYTGVGQIGLGRYRFQSTYTPGGCVHSTYTGHAQLVRFDGAPLTGTLTGESDCFPGGHGPPIVNAVYTLDLSGTSDLVHAHLAVACSWAVAVSVSGTPGEETCNASGEVVVTQRIGYVMVDDHGQSIPFGGLPFAYPVRTPTPTAMSVAITPSRNGYWFVNGAGHVFPTGDAKSFGSAPTLPPGETVLGIAPMPAGNGYWLVTCTGRVLPFGAATFRGDMHATRLNRPIVGAAPTPDGKGYWLAASDGGIFAFGTARYFGSTGGIRLNQPVVAFAPTEDGRGYWLVARDGGVFSFGDARFRGSMGATHLNQPITSASRYGAGYLLLAADGGVFNFGTLPFFGSLVPQATYPIVAVAAIP